MYVCMYVNWFRGRTARGKRVVRPRHKPGRSQRRRGRRLRRCGADSMHGKEDHREQQQRHCERGAETGSAVLRGRRPRPASTIRITQDNAHALVSNTLSSRSFWPQTSAIAASLVQVRPGRTCQTDEQRAPQAWCALASEMEPALHACACMDAYYAAWLMFASRQCMRLLFQKFTPPLTSVPPG